MASNVVQLRPNAGPHSPVTLPGGWIQTASSFGLDHTTIGPQFDAFGLYNSERAKNLEYRERFYRCTQHDWKVFDFEGRMQQAKQIMGVQPLIGGNMPNFYVPLNQRRPSAPYRLPRTIVHAFTGLLFGHNRWPQIRSDDPQTQDFAEALIKACGFRAKAVRLRNIGGSCGTAGMSWAFIDGKPRVRVHSGRAVHVIEWEDEEEQIPAHVVQLYMTSRQVVNERTRKLEQRAFWFRRDWTRDADVAFHLEPVTDKNPPVWRVDEERSFRHDDGFCHFVWVQNIPDDEPDGVDGQPDYAELYEQCNTIDVLNSVVVTGAQKNLDPTLVLKMENEEIQGAIIKKGSDNALAVGPGGSADYLELSGAATNAGQGLVDKQREQVLEVAQCVVPDPDKVVAAGTSSVALKMIYAPMLGKGEILRDQYGPAIQRVLEQMIASARRRMPDPDDDYVLVVRTDEEGNEVEEPVQFVLDLPPRLEKIEVLDEDGNPTGEERVERYERRPGSGGIELEWGEWFPPTPDDKQKAVGAAQQATGGKPVMSQRTGVDIIAAMFNKDPQSEWLALADERQQQAAAEGAMFPPIGGPVGEEDELPPGAELQEPGAEPARELPELPQSELAAIMTVDEWRVRYGLSPIGGEEGRMTVAEFKAYRAARAAEAGKVVGGAEGQAEAALVTPPAPEPQAPPGEGTPPPATPPAAPPA